MDRFRGLVDHFVVHRPAEQRMRMAHDSRRAAAARLLFAAEGPQDRFQASRGTGQHQSSMRLFGMRESM